jgi:hypothetical protein
MRYWMGGPAVLLALGIVGCAPMMGRGVGSTLSGAQRATFDWKSTSVNSGQMTATLSDGETFSGTYIQITRDTQVDTLGPLWAGWGPGFRRWGYWGPTNQFVTEYTGQVVGNLEAANGSHMRCRFTLAYPASGLSGGGLGQCELPDGTTIDAQFPAT